MDETRDNTLPRPVDESTLPVKSGSSLDQRSLELINQIISETDEDKTKDLTYLFNMNQNKKTLVRIDKLSGLQDSLVEQFLKRITEKPDAISNKELMDALKIVQDIMERGRDQVSGNEGVAPNAPFIQINQQTNSVNLGPQTELNRDSRARVKDAVLKFLGDLQIPAAPAEVVDPIDNEGEDHDE